MKNLIEGTMSTPTPYTEEEMEKLSKAHELIMSVIKPKSFPFPEGEWPCLSLIIHPDNPSKFNFRWLTPDVYWDRYPGLLEKFENWIKEQDELKKT